MSDACPRTASVQRCQALSLCGPHGTQHTTHNTQHTACRSACCEGEGRARPSGSTSKGHRGRPITDHQLSRRDPTVGPGLAWPGPAPRYQRARSVLTAAPHPRSTGAGTLYARGVGTLSGLISPAAVAVSIYLKGHACFSGFSSSLTLLSCAHGRALRVHATEQNGTGKKKKKKEPSLDRAAAASGRRVRGGGVCLHRRWAFEQGQRAPW